MPVDLYSKRRKRARGEVPEVFVYDVLPEPLRVQIVQIIREALCLPEGNELKTREIYKSLHDLLCREYGVFSLIKARAGHDNVQATVEEFCLATDVDRALDLVELAFRYVERAQRTQFLRPTLAPRNAIDELNERFREHGVGFQFEAGEIIRVDSQILHAEVVKPALALLNEREFVGANDEFLSAYEHYRHGRNKEALNDALKSVESILKSICTARGWAYNERDTARRLIEIVFQNKLLPGYLQAHFAALRSTLESGVPTLRNRESAHGQGIEELSVPRQIVAYALHLTAAAIIFIVQSNDASEKRLANSTVDSEKHG